MSADNGLLVKKNSEGSFDVYYLVADNQFYENTFKDKRTWRGGGESNRGS